jgi:hypothetical protein
MNPQTPQQPLPNVVYPTAPAPVYPAGQVVDNGTLFWIAGAALLGIVAYALIAGTEDQLKRSEARERRDREAARRYRRLIDYGEGSPNM